MLRREALMMIAAAPVAASPAVQASSRDRTSVQQAHVAWVIEAFTRMQTIQPGQTRRELLEVFTTEGGLSNPLQRTLASKDCPYFKVDVTLQAIGRSARDVDGRVTMVEDPRDVILSISKPYLDWTIAD